MTHGKLLLYDRTCSNWHMRLTVEIPFSSTRYKVKNWRFFDQDKEKRVCSIIWKTEKFRSTNNSPRKFLHCKFQRCSENYKIQTSDIFNSVQNWMATAAAKMGEQFDSINFILHFAAPPETKLFPSIRPSRWWKYPIEF